MLFAQRIVYFIDDDIAFVFEKHRCKERDEADDRKTEQHSGIRTTDKQHAEQDRHEHHRTAEVGLYANQQRRHCREHRWNDEFLEFADFRFAQDEIFTERDDQHQLHELCGLKAQAKEAYPRTCALDFFADKGHQHQKQNHNSGCIDYGSERS